MFETDTILAFNDHLPNIISWYFYILVVLSLPVFYMWIRESILEHDDWYFSFSIVTTALVFYPITSIMVGLIFLINFFFAGCYVIIPWIVKLFKMFYLKNNQLNIDQSKDQNTF
jgi:hypothetical protein